MATIANTDALSAPRGRLPVLVALGLALVAALAAVHVTQGTASVGAADLWRLVGGGGTEQETAIVVASRLPRLAAALLVGVALGAAGAALQSVARNPLASPDTLAVNAGAYLALALIASTGVALPLLGGGAAAFVGGLLAAGLVLALSAGGGSGTVRLVLAGSAIAIALNAITTVFLLLFSQETIGLFAWGAGSLGQTGMDGVAQLAPVVALALVALIALGRRLDVLALGDDTASVLGVAVFRTRTIAVVLAVVLSAAAVTVAGPIGFVGLCAPAIVRLLAPRVPGLHRSRALIPVSSLAGVIVVLGSDVLLRLLFGGQGGVEIPTGVVTTVVGAVFLVVLARRMKDSTTPNDPPGLGARAIVPRWTLLVLFGGAVALGLVVLMAGLLLGDAKLLLGDLANWATGTAGPITEYVLNARIPRVLAALLAGAALAVAGAVVQSVSRNPLAEPGILGVSGGAGVGAIAVITAVPLASVWTVTGGAALGAACAALVVFGLAAKGGLRQNRLVLIGIGVSAGSAAITSLLIVLTDPFNAAKAITWLSGSTYGRTLPQVLPIAVALLIAIPVLGAFRRELDLLRIDDDTPRILGVPLGRARLGLLALSVLLTATAVSAVGVIAFVGLVAPHAARMLVGSRHSRALPMSALLGGILVMLADLLGRTAIAPAQLPAGLLTALVGAPYFLYLLWRSRRVAR